ncbi:Maf family protein [Lacticaseibacillus zhaodongensis]|uniref:Maf family protein n=1 Tax=Lacticaseibacillus zhaodongensis TaxID=2668065 RepID=UPI0012D31DCE|nr:Maf family protein [Lacticaseibacillus zhaodongensis]
MIVLASSSPRRQELLRRIYPDFVSDPADIDERALPMLPAPEYVATLAHAKGASVARRHPGAVVIGADTVVEIDGHILGKPQNRTDACDMLQMLSGHFHHVHTGVWIRFSDGSTKEDVVTTSVEFWHLTNAELNAYLDKGTYQGKAGAYGIQDDGAMLIKRIDGDFYSVMGLPISRLNRMLRDADGKLAE